MHVPAALGGDGITSAGFFVHDTVSNLIFVDDVVARAYELPERDARRGLPLRVYMDKVHPDDVPVLRQTILEHEVDGIFHYSHRILRADGSTMQARTSGYDFHLNGIPQRRVGMIEFAASEDLTPMERFVDHCLITYQLAIEAGQPMIQYYIGLALMEAGFDLARSMRLDAEE